MTILIVAEHDFIGAALAQRFADRGCRHISYPLAELPEGKALVSFLSEQQVTQVINSSLVSLPAAQLPGYLQQGPLLSLLTAVEQLQLPYIQLSSSHVFNSAEPRRYKVSDLAEPDTELGQIYRRVESYTRKHVQRYIILRTGALFSERGDNVLTHLLAQFKQGGDISLSLHGHSAPVYMDDLARVVSGLVDQLGCGTDEWGVNVWGEYHYNSSDPTTYYHFAESLLAVMAQHINVEQVNLVGVEAPDNAWQYPLLNCSKILSAFGIKQMPWRSSVVNVVKRYCKEVVDE
ncbi:sugar nucleotide-binding protein [Dasania marina]|uniref:sugar nucleotide-binding protein n=1 Tax=Dasania marina TaxID=471499 RepID=UPI0030DCBF4F